MNTVSKMTAPRRESGKGLSFCFECLLYLPRAELERAVVDLFQQLLIAHGLAVEIALEAAAAGLAQEVHRLLGLHALAEGHHVQGICKVYDAGDDLAGVLVVVEVLQKLHVDLEKVEVEVLEHVHGRVAGAEVVEPDGKAPVVQALHGAL